MEYKLGSSCEDPVRICEEKRVMGMNEGMLFRCVLFTAAGFLSGSVMYSLLLPKAFKNIDVRAASSDGNPGGINAMRAAGKGMGLLCIALDVLKAYIPVRLSLAYLGADGLWLVPAVAAPVLGHAFSPFLRFKGGKAISTLFGAVLALWPVSRAIAILVFFTVLFKFAAVVRPDSAGFVVSVCASGAAVFFLEPLAWVRTAFFLSGAVVLYRLLRNPNAGEMSLTLGRCVFCLADRRLKIIRR